MITKANTRKALRRLCAGILAAGMMSAASSALAASLVRIGTINASSDVGFFIADKRGYFKQEGIEVQFIPFDSAAKMVAPLGTSQLEVGSGAPSSALYNAVARGIDIKIVADKGSTPPGHGFQPLLVRKDLIDSGKVKTFADLKGMKIASGSIGISTSVTLSEALKQGGLTMADVSVVSMGYPQHVVALQNKAVDAALTTEPSATMAVKSGTAVRFATDDVIYPYHQLAVVIFGGGFIKGNPETAQKFMRAYVRGIRDYNDALKDGRLIGAKADAIISILTEYTQIKDADIYRAMISHGTNPDGGLNMDSLRKDFAYFKSEGLIEGNVTVQQAVDDRFVRAAVKELGPYKPMKE